MIRLVENLICYNKNLWSGKNRKECTKILHIAYRTIFFFKLAGNYNAFAKWYNNHVVSRSCSKGRSKYLVETTLCRGFIEKMFLHSQPRRQTVLHYLRIWSYRYSITYSLLTPLYRQPNSIAYAKMMWLVNLVCPTKVHFSLSKHGLI